MAQIEYSEKYYDGTYEYRNVELPPDVARLLTKNLLLTENEWRGIGVQQDRGWEHYAIHHSEPHIMLFRRHLNYDQNHQHPEAHIMLFRRPFNHQQNQQQQATTAKTSSNRHNSISLSDLDDYFIN